MQAFLMHVGSPGNHDLKFTVTKRRSFKEVLGKLPTESVERRFFEREQHLRSVYPDGRFHCWGVPQRAEPAFRQTKVGDLVLFAPHIRRQDGGIYQIGVVKSLCPEPAYHASQILWPETPYERLYPFLFFFDTETGYYNWHHFLDDLGIARNWRPAGWYRRLRPDRFDRFDGVAGYLDRLRSQHDFRPLA